MTERTPPLPYPELRNLNRMIAKMRDSSANLLPGVMDAVLTLTLIHCLLADLMLRFAVLEGRRDELHAHIEAKSHE